MTIPLSPKQMKAQQAYTQTLAQKRDVEAYLRGLLGNGLGTVLGSKPGYYKVRLPQINNVVIEAYNARGLQAVEGTPVIVGYDPYHPNLLKILDYDLPDSVTEVDNTGKVNPADGSDPESGAIGIRDFTPLIVTKGTGNFVIDVASGLVPTDTGWFLVEETSLDFATLQGTLESGFGVFVLIYIDREGGVQYKASSPRLLELLSYRNIPYPAPFGGYALAGVQLYAGQIAITENVSTTDIVDLRFPQVNYYNIVMQLLATIENKLGYKLDWHIFEG